MKKNKFITRVLSVIMAGSLFGAFLPNAFDGKVNAENSLEKTSAITSSLDKLDYDIHTDPEKYFDQNVVFKLPEGLSENDEISVLVSMQEATVIDVYENFGGSFELSEFVTSEMAAETERKIDLKRNELISDIRRGGVDFEVGEKYNTLLSGFEITIKAGDFSAVEQAVGSKATLIIGDEYEKSESKVVTNEVDVYSTGIFDSSSSKYQGDGVVVAILDTGLDYTHPAFDVNHFNIKNPAFTYESVSEKVGLTTAAKLTAGLTGADVYMNVKVPYAYDYADNDSDVLPINSEHGTHVAGIIAGKDDEIVGVAPDAQLAIMKVFSDHRTGAKTSWIIAALEDCVTLGVDVINMSLGSSNGFTREVDKERVNVIYDKIKACGISLIVSAGNEANATRGSKKNGTNGLTTNPDSGTVGSPSTYDASLSIASVDGVKTPYFTYNGRIIYFNEATNSSAKKKDFVTEILRTVGDNVSSHEFEFVTIPGIGRPTDYPSVKEYYKGKIVLVKRGETTFEEKIRTALVDMGAAGVIIYNNISGTISMSVGQDVGAACSISQDDGEFLAAARTGKILISQQDKAGPFMSDFSSWGPTSDLRIKPEITGHGGEIYSSVPGRSYDRMSGTSMAAPNVAGATALIRQFVKYTPSVFGDDLTSTEITAIVNRLMMSTADIVYNKNGLPYAVRKQGAGLVNITKSSTASAYLITYDGEGREMDKTKLELGDDKNKTGVYEMTFAIKNISNKALSYDVNSIMITEGVSETYTGHGDTTVTQDGYLLSGAETSVLSVEGGRQNGNNVTVEARGLAKVTLKVVLSDEDKEYLEKSFKNGMYVEGFIVLTSSDDEVTNLNIPVLAFYGDWTKAPIFDEEYYDTNPDELNAAIDDDDKLMADSYATRVYGGLYSDYISTMGAYYFVQNPQASQIGANKEHISISNQTSSSSLSVNAIKSISAGLLRNAKQVDISIVEEATGLEIFNKSEYNISKSSSYGSDMYGTTIDVDFKALEHDLKNNTKYIVTVTAFIDYGEKSEQKNARNTFTFPLYVDFEAPVVTGVTYRTEYDSTSKKTSYFADISVYDNHYSMGLSFGQIIPSTSPEYAFEMNSFGKYITPIYSTYNAETLVSLELTDYIAEIKKSAGVKISSDGEATIEYNNNSFIAAVYDYALNSAVYQLRLPDEFISVDFTKDEVELSLNETLRLEEIMEVYPSNSWLNTLDYEVSAGAENIIEVVNQTIVAKSEGEAQVIVKGYDDNGKNVVKATLKVKVTGEDKGYTVPQVSKFEVKGYKVEKAFYSVNSSDREIGITGGIYEFGQNPNLSMFPSESVTVNCSLDSYDPELTSLKYESSAEDIVEVTPDGKITALSKGDATVFVYVWFGGQPTYYSGTINITVKDPFETLSIYLNSYKGLGGVVEIPDDRGITTINSYAFSGYEYVDKDLSAGDVIDEEDPYYIKQAALSEDTITKVIIPEGVTTIEQSAFENLTALEEVVLPQSLIRIGRQAFKGCVKLKTINLEHVKFINEEAFMNCDISRIDLSEIVAIGSYAFRNCKVKRLILPENSQSLGEGAFYGNGDLYEVEFKAEKIKVGPRVFENCGIERIEINASVIAPYAFYNCVNLDEATLGADVSVIGEYAFAGTNVSSFEIDPNNSYFKTEEGTDGGIIVTKDGERIVLVAPKYRESGTITTNVRYIGAGAFSGCLATRIIANNATEIGAYAFVDCKKLTTVSLESVETIGAYAFKGTDINRADYLLGVKEIGEGAFLGTKIKNVEVGDDCVIGAYAFAECYLLENVVLGNGVSVGDYAFYNTVVLYAYDENAGKSNVIDDKTVDRSVEDDYTVTAEDLENIIAHYDRYMSTDELGNVYEDYRYRFFDGVRSNLKSVTVGDGVKFGRYSFAGNANVKNLTLGDGAEIGAYAFYNAAELSEVDLSEVLTIGEYAFSGLYTRDLRLYQGVFGYAYTVEYDEEGNEVYRTVKNTYFSPKFTLCNLEKATSVGEGAFAYNASLEKIVLGVSIEKIEAFTFAGCLSVNQIENANRLSEIGEFAFYGVAAKNVDLTNAVSVGAYAFAESKLESVVLGDNAVIYAGAFARCDKLGQVTGLEKAKLIGANAFNGCALTTVDVSSAEFIGDFAFANSEAEEVVFGENLVQLGENPFYNCKALSSFGKTEPVYFNGQEIGNNFTENFEISDYVKVVNGALYAEVPNGTVLISYPYAKNGSSFIVEEGTVRISEKAFYGSNISNVTLPSTLKSIGDKAFYACDNLTTVVFRSYYAPVLEEAYDTSYITYSNLPISGYTTARNTVYKGLGIVDYFMWNVALHGNNYYFGANFRDYVGKVDGDIVMVYPANGVNYDSFILSKYFTTKVAGVNAATDDTLKAIELIDEIPDYISLSDEKTITAARTAYDAIPTIEQKALVTNYSKLTSAEFTLEYLKTRDNEEPSVKPDEPADENKDGGANMTAVVLAIISGALNLLLIAGIVVLIVMKFKSGDKKEENETSGNEEEKDK